MSISIVKHLGYGLIVDDSLVEETFVDGLVERLEELTLGDYYQFLLKKNNNFRLTSYMKFEDIKDVSPDLFTMSEELFEEYNKKSLASLISFGQWSKFETFVCVSPELTHELWVRRDDAIDYAEFFVSPDRRVENVSKFLSVAPSPYNGFYMDKYDGRVLDSRLVRSVKSLANVTDTGEAVNGGDAKSLLLLGKLCEQLGYKNFLEFSSRVSPAVPVEVKDLVECVNMFKKPDGWVELSPCVLTYWV